MKDSLEQRKHNTFTKSSPIDTCLNLYTLYVNVNSWRLEVTFYLYRFPGGSDGKAFACNVGDLGLIPGLGGSPGEGNGNPFPVPLPGKSHEQRRLVGYIHGAAKSWT